jgi:hypothetical protein
MMPTTSTDRAHPITRELISLVKRRGHDKALGARTVTRSCHAVKSVDPVLSLGVRAATHADYWNRHAEARMNGGIAASTVRAELNSTAAVLKWIVHSDTPLKTMSPASARAAHDAIREAARKTGKRIKRFAALAKPARVSLDEFDDVVRDINAFKSPHREICLMCLCFALRVSESQYMKPANLIQGKLFIPDRVVKTRANLLIPLPVKYLKVIGEWVSKIEAKPVSYAALEMYILRKGVKWRAHDLRKLFRTAAAVRGDDYLAAELILNHDIGEVQNVYLQKPPVKQMRAIIKHTLDEVMAVE